MPKCCDGNKILKRNKNGPHHGFDCVDSDSELSLDIKLTDTNLTKIIENHQAEMKFVSGVFPACDGLEPNWSYENHDQFSVDVTQKERYFLLLKDSKVRLDLFSLPNYWLVYILYKS